MAKFKHRVVQEERSVFLVEKVGVIVEGGGARSLYEHVSISEWLRRQSCLNHQNILHYIFVCGVEWTAKFTKEMSVHESYLWLAF